MSTPHTRGARTSYTLRCIFTHSADTLRVAYSHRTSFASTVMPGVTLSTLF
uniref:Uncharacterized protein n=1 Tax=Anguilla anguilla TaxID=7936 RepID=A0A0E9T3F8_ANGAN